MLVFKLSDRDTYILDIYNRYVWQTLIIHDVKHFSKCATSIYALKYNGFKYIASPFISMVLLEHLIDVRLQVINFKRVENSTGAG